MATAEKIAFSSASPVQLWLAEKTATVVSQVDAVPASASKRSNVQITAQAPRLVASQPQPLDFVDALVAYMTSVLNQTVALAGQQSTITQAQTAMSQNYVAGAKDAAQTAVDALQKAQKAEAEEQKKSLWQTVLGYVGAGILCALGLVTANPELVIMGGLMVADQATGATDKLEQYLTQHLANLSPALQKFVTILIKVAIALAMAVVVGGVVGGIEAAADETVEKSFADKTLEYGFKNGKGFMGYGQFTATFTQMMVIVNPFTDMMQGIASAIPMSAASQKLFAQVMGLVTALVLAYVAGKYTGVDGAPSMAQKIAGSMSQTLRTGIKTALGLLLSGDQMAQGILEMQQSVLMKDQAKATSLFGGMQALQLLFTNNATQVSQMIKQSQASATGVNNAFAAMNDRWDEYVAPYQLSAEITG